METRICKTCKLKKNISEFATESRNFKIKFLPHCYECFRNLSNNFQKKYYNNNIERLREKQRDNYLDNIELEQARKRIYRQENKEEIKNRRKIKARELRKSDPGFRLKENISRRIRQALRKNGNSYLKYISYTVQELKDHIARQFEPWMNWNNQGIYNKNTWDDNDTSTWTWQIDHIVPHSKLKYFSMEDDNFKKCWALRNLRPLSAKANFVGGINLLKEKKNVSLLAK